MFNSHLSRCPDCGSCYCLGDCLPPEPCDCGECSKCSPASQEHSFDTDSWDFSDVPEPHDDFDDFLNDDKLLREIYSEIPEYVPTEQDLQDLSEAFPDDCEENS